MTDNRHPAGTSLGGRWAPGSAEEIDEAVEEFTAFESEGARREIAASVLDIRSLVNRPAQEVRDRADDAASEYSLRCSSAGIEPDDQALADLRAISDRPRREPDEVDAELGLRAMVGWKSQYADHAASGIVRVEDAAESERAIIDPYSTQKRLDAMRHNSMARAFRSVVPGVRSVQTDSARAFDSDGDEIELSIEDRARLRSRIDSFEPQATEQDLTIREIPDKLCCIISERPSR